MVDLILEGVKMALFEASNFELLQAGHLCILDSIECQHFLRVLQVDPDGMEERLLNNAVKATKPGYIVLPVPLQATGLLIPA